MERKILNRPKLQQTAWVIAGGLASLGLISIASPAAAVTFNLDGGSDFIFDADFTTASGVGTPGGTLNTSTGNAGFNSFFDTFYGRLGALNRHTATSLANNRGSSSAVSIIDIVFPADELADARSVEVTFSYAFAGTAGNPGEDTIEVFLFDPATGESTQSLQITDLAPTGIPLITYELTGEDLATLAAETSYKLIFQLSETTDSNNTAFGFDEVVVETVPIPFEAEFSSVAGLLTLGGFWGFSQLRKKAREVNIRAAVPTRSVAGWGRIARASRGSIPPKMPDL